MIFGAYQTLALPEIVHLKATQGLTTESFFQEYPDSVNFAFKTTWRP